MELFRQLHEDHDVLDAQMTRFEEFLNRAGRGHAAALDQVARPLLERLVRHISFEEVHFYAPLKASGQARHDLMAILDAEHEDLLKTAEHLQHLRHRARAGDAEEEFEIYGLHLIELYREHTDREHRWLFPLLEQPPPPIRRPSGAIRRAMTLNAVIRQFPELLHVLHAFRLDYPWHGTETVEEAARFRSMGVEELLDALNGALDAHRPLSEPAQDESFQVA